MFPFAEYKSVVLSESEARKVRAEAMILNFERDSEDGENFLIAVKFMGQCDASLFEDGTVSQEGEGAFHGEIVELDVPFGMLTVKAVGAAQPKSNLPLYLQPADYLEKLLEFATHIAESENGEKAARFDTLKQDLLSATDLPSQGHTLGEAPDLRQAQSKALEMARRRQTSFIWGPPGTGKSYTLGHIAADFRAQGKRILLLSNTNAAVDVATFAIDDACRQRDQSLKPGQLIRYTRVLAKPAEYMDRPHLLEYTRLLQRFAMRERELAKRIRDAKESRMQFSPNSADFSRLSFEILAATAELTDLGKKRKAEVEVMLAHAQIVCATLTSAMYNGFVSSGAFDVVLFDEASVMALVVWPYLLYRFGPRTPRYVIAGDPMQLPPVFTGMSGTANERWFGRNIYSYLGMSDWSGIRPFVDGGAMTLLNEQTRMRREICSLVSARFYGGLLVGDRTDETRPWSDASRIPQAQVVLLDPGMMQPYVTKAKWGQQGGAVSHTSLTSAALVEGLVRKMIPEAPVLGAPLEVLIITPFVNQARYVYERRMKALEHLGNVRISVSTVHRSQGAEADVVFFDTIDAGSWFLKKPEAAKLWCVACSRARRQLFVLANENALRQGTHSGPLFGDIPFVDLPD